MPPAARSSLALAAALLLAAACSGGGTSGSASGGSGLSRAQYVARAGRICHSYQRRISALKRTTDLAQLALQGRRAVALESAELAELRRLAPPPADRQAVARMLSSLRGAIAAANALVSSAQAGDAAAVSAAAADLRARLSDTARLARPFGLDACAG
jgi:hypothetical protein